MALLNCRTSTPGISSGSGSSPMQSQLLFFRLALSSLSMNFIAVTQIISGDGHKLKLAQHSTILEGYCAGRFGNYAQNGHEAKASHYIFNQPWQRLYGIASLRLQ